MGEPYPLLPRAFAGLGAAAVGAWFVVLAPLANLQAGHPWTAGALALAALPLALFLALLALAPDALQRLLSRATRLDLRDAGHVGCAVIMAGTLFFVLGLGIADGVLAVETRFGPAADPEAAQDENEGLDPVLLGSALTLNLIVLTLPALLYVSFVGGTGPAGALRALGLREEGAGRALGVGAGAAFLVLLAIMIVSGLLHFAGFRMPENEQALRIARSITVAGALGIAVVSSVSEEIFFRGFLQPRIGLLAQGVLFSLVHLNYVHVPELVVTFALGILFGILYRRTGSLWAPIAAHFTFNLVMLLAGMYVEAPPSTPDANATTPE